mmetsp:Transcript_11/g.31  ORF Transcript_11/g.31 Transcript_11/m.31 type:complete len:318 (+) Transcript_11:155-1108(+)
MFSPQHQHPSRRLHAGVLHRGVDLVEDDQREHSVGRNADVVGGETGVELERSARRHGLHAAVAEALERQRAVGEGLLLLELGLDVVEGEGEEGREEPGDGGRAEGGRETGDVVLLHHLLGLVVGSEHAHVQCHGADGRGAGAGEQTADALLLDDVAQRVDDTGVVTALVHRERLIGLHADEGEIRGGAEHGSEAASGETSASFLRKGEGSALVRLLEVVDDLGVNAEARGGVGGLAEETRGETRVEGAEAIVLDDTRGDAEGTAGGTELKANLDDVEGLDDARGTHAGEATVQERLDGLPGRVITERHGWREVEDCG